jgi:hypothetical protein
MTHRFTLPAMLSAIAVLALAPLARAGGGPSIYLVSKTQNFLQTSTAAPIADPDALYVIDFQAPAAATYTPPSEPVVTPLLNSGNSDYELSQEFATETTLNTAFPSGTYKVTPGSSSAVSFSFSGDSYPTVTPSITGGTWLPGGILVLNPAVSNTINISTFSTYASAGVAGEMEIDFSADMAPSFSGNVGQQQATQAIFGLTSSSTPFTSYTIPAGTMTAGGIYDVKIQFNTLSSLDTTSISGSGVVSIYGKQTVAYIIAESSTTSTETAPSMTSQPTNQTAAIGGTATFSFGENFDSNTTTLFFFNGKGLDINGSKYGYNTANAGLVQLTINNVAATDAGEYYAIFVSPVGVVESASATLATTAAVTPTVTTQPNEVLPAATTAVPNPAMSINTGSTVVLTAVVTGGPSYQWELNGNPLSNSNGGSGSDIISGANGSQLVISNASAASNGSYTLVATNGAGSVTTAPVPLTVSPSSSPGYLISISTRADVLTGDNILIGGFYIVGSTSRTILVQAIGPGIAAPPYNVTGTLADPSLAIHHSDSQGVDHTLYTNTGWSTGVPAIDNILLSTAATAYAQPVLTVGSKDSELLLTLPPGGYTAEVFGAAGTSTDTGVALVGIYELN